MKHEDKMIGPKGRQAIATSVRAWKRDQSLNCRGPKGRQVTAAGSRELCRSVAPPGLVKPVNRLFPHALTDVAISSHAFGAHRTASFDIDLWRLTLQYVGKTN
jgi:hypothetical protein